MSALVQFILTPELPIIYIYIYSFRWVTTLLKNHLVYLLTKKSSVQLWASVYKWLAVNQLKLLQHLEKSIWAASAALCVCPFIILTWGTGKFAKFSKWRENQLIETFSKILTTTFGNNFPHLTFSFRIIV